MLSWQRMQVTVRLGSPFPGGPGTQPPSGAVPSPSSSLAPAGSPLSRSLSFVRVSAGFPSVEEGVEGGGRGGPASTPPSWSAGCCLMEQDFLCFSRLRTNTLTPHW